MPREKLRFEKALEDLQFHARMILGTETAHNNNDDDDDNDDDSNKAQQILGKGETLISRVITLLN